MMRNLDLCFIDLETTGLSPDSEIIEMAVIRVRQDDLTLVDEWSVKVKPEHLDRADSGALAVNQYSEEEWKEAYPIKSALEVFLDKTKDSVLVGHNLMIDWMWLSHWLHQTGLMLNFRYKPGRFYYQGFDTISLAYAKLRHIESLQLFSLDELTKYFGINRKQAHRALDDARATYELFVKLINY